MTIYSFFIGPTYGLGFNDRLYKQTDTGWSPVLPLKFLRKKAFLFMVLIKMIVEEYLPKQTLILLDDWEKIRSN